MFLIDINFLTKNNPYNIIETNYNGTLIHSNFFIVKNLIDLIKVDNQHNVYNKIDSFLLMTKKH